MNVFTLKEGMFSVGNSKSFQPFEKGKDQLSERERGSFLLAVQPFLIVIGQEIVLLDTGLGQSDGSILQLIKNINQVGFQVEDITMVLLSHLHRDHIGGIFSSSEPDSDLTFPNATYYAQKRELEYALEQEHVSYDLNVLKRIESSSRFSWMTEDKGGLSDFITYEVAGGHTPYHQVFWFREEKETFFYGADIAPQLFFMRNKLIGKYDFDGKRTMQLREGFLQRAKEENWTILFYHDIECPLWNPNDSSL